MADKTGLRMLRLRAYCYPEQTAGTHMDDALRDALAQNGITYILYTPTPTRNVSEEVRREYKKKDKRLEITHDGHVIIHRFSMFREGTNPIQKTLRFLLCNIREYHLGIRERDIDLVFSSSTPPTQGTLSGFVAKKLSKRYRRKVPFVYLLQDIFPDSLVNAGMTQRGSLIWRIGRRIEDRTYRNADRIIVISESFKRNIMAKGVPEEKIEIISNWVDLDAITPVPRADNPLFDEMGISRERFIVVYAGNIGEAQGAEVILDAARLLRDEDILFVIFGGGARYPALKKAAEDRELGNVIITGLRPVEDVKYVYSLGDAALITCRPGTGDAGMPSKTWSIMACGTPIIASFDRDSDLEDTLTRSGAGRCVEPGSASALADAVLEARKGRRAAASPEKIREYALANVSREACVGRYIGTIKNAVESAADTEE